MQTKEDGSPFASDAKLNKDDGCWWEWRWSLVFNLKTDNKKKGKRVTGSEQKHSKLIETNWQMMRVMNRRQCAKEVNKKPSWWKATFWNDQTSKESNAQIVWTGGIKPNKNRLSPIKRKNRSN